MSDQKRGPAWWLASDGKWYPPQSRPLPTEPTPLDAPPKKSWWRRRVPLWALILAAVLGLVVGAAAAGTDPEEEQATATTDEEPTTTTSQPTTTTRPTTTTTAKPTTTTTKAPEVPKEVARFQGDADTETVNFTVKGRWTIQAIVSGGAGIIVEIYDDASAESVDFLDFDPGDTTSQIRQGGTLYLDISQFGSTYTVVIVDQPD